MDDFVGVCDQCGSEFRYRLLHNGFGDSAYAYCDTCPFTVSLSGWGKEAQRVKVRIHQRITPDVEPLLKPCPCGGKFSATADPKCPQCGHPLSADEATAFIEQNASGTAKGWRWQRSWSGIYSIVLNEKVVQDWWDADVVRRLYLDT